MLLIWSVLCLFRLAAHTWKNICSCVSGSRYACALTDCSLHSLVLNAFHLLWASIRSVLSRVNLTLILFSVSSSSFSDSEWKCSAQTFDVYVSPKLKHSLGFLAEKIIPLSSLMYSVALAAIGISKTAKIFKIFMRPHFFRLWA